MDKGDLICVPVLQGVIQVGVRDQWGQILSLPPNPSDKLHGNT